MRGFRPAGAEARELSRRRGTEVWGAMLTLGVAFALLTGIIRFLAGNAAVMEAEMRRFAPPELTGLPEAEYPAMAVHIADYLAGRKESFQFFRTVSGSEQVLCFHDYEMAHMADCRALIRLDGIVCAVSLSLAVLSAGMILCRGRPGKRGRETPEAGPAEIRDAGFAPGDSARRGGGEPGQRPAGESLGGAKRALGFLSLIAAGLALWAAVNFDGLFVTFHRAAFRNERWLLNPRTDLLIRLMPEEMFADLGLKGLGAFAAGLAVLFAAGRLIWKRSIS